MNWNGKNKAFTLSFDDGVVQDIRFIELLNKYGLKGTFNLNSGLLGQGGILTMEGKSICHYKLRREDIREIYAGHEIAGHTLTHPNLTKHYEREILRQVEVDRYDLSEIAGYEVVGMAYPCGGVNNDDRVARFIKQNTGVKYARTITCNESFDLQYELHRFQPTVFHLDLDKMWELGRKFVELKTDKPQIFYVWGHTYEYDYSPDSLQKTEEFFKFISNRADIFYGTNKEVLLGKKK